MNRELLRTISRPGLALAGFALLGAMTLAFVYGLTKPLMQANEREAELSRMSLLVDKHLYDNDPLQDQVTLPAADFHSADDVVVYRARNHNQPVAAFFKVIAPDGYSGKIELLVAIRADQSLAGVRVLKHKETPGLGDKIEEAKHPWILNFTDKSLQHPTVDAWAVKKDGGAFDQFTGATITPRAVVKQVRNTLQWSAQQFTWLFTQPAMPAKEQ